MQKLLRFKSSLIVLLAVAISGFAIKLYWGAPYFAHQLVEQQLVKKAKGWHGGILSFLDNGRFTFTLGEVTPNDRSSLDVFIQVSDSYRYVFLQRDGIMFWSSAAEKIGKKEGRKYFAEIVAKGSVYVKHQRKKPSEVDGLAAPPSPALREVIEIYVPVMRDGEFVGAIEHYFDATSNIESLTSNIRLIVAGLSIVALFFRRDDRRPSYDPCAAPEKAAAGHA